MFHEYKRDPDIFPGFPAKNAHRATVIHLLPIPDMRQVSFHTSGFSQMSQNSRIITFSHFDNWTVCTSRITVSRPENPMVNITVKN